MIKVGIAGATGWTGAGAPAITGLTRGLDTLLLG